MDVNRAEQRMITDAVKRTSGSLKDATQLKALSNAVEQCAGKYFDLCRHQQQILQGSDKSFEKLCDQVTIWSKQEAHLLETAPETVRKCYDTITSGKHVTDHLKKTSILENTQTFPPAHSSQVGNANPPLQKNTAPQQQQQISSTSEMEAPALLQEINRRPPVGMPNLGNTCWLNSLVQVLLKQNSDLAATLLGPKFLHSYCEAQRKGKGLPEETINDLRARWKDLTGSNIFLNNAQHDPTEALTLLLLTPLAKPFNHKETIARVWKNESQVSDADIIQAIQEQKNSNGTEKYGFPVQSVQKGILRGDASQDFNGVVNVGYQQGRSLKDLINNKLTKTEGGPKEREIDTNRGVAVLNKQSATVKWGETLPYLMFQVRKMESDDHADRQQVINTVKKTAPLNEVEEMIELSPEHFSDGQAHAYKLQGFICHSGTAIDQGHYMAYERRNGKYYWCNDSVIKEISRDAFLEAAKSGSQLDYELIS